MTIQWNDAKIKQVINDAAHNGLDAVATVIADRAVGLFGTDHGGVPSLPGEPPNSQTGNLYKSITRTRAENFKASLGTAVEYGRHLEFGTRNIAPRPWIRPAMNLSLQAAKSAFIAGFKVSLRRAGVI